VIGNNLFQNPITLKLLTCINGDIPQLRTMLQLIIYVNYEELAATCNATGSDPGTPLFYQILV